MISSRIILPCVKILGIRRSGHEGSCDGNTVPYKLPGSSKCLSKVR